MDSRPLDSGEAESRSKFEPGPGQPPNGTAAAPQDDDRTQTDSANYSAVAQGQGKWLPQGTDDATSDGTLALVAGKQPELRAEASDGTPGGEVREHGTPEAQYMLDAASADVKRYATLAVEATGHSAERSAAAAQVQAENEALKTRLAQLQTRIMQLETQSLSSPDRSKSPKHLDALHATATRQLEAIEAQQSLIADLEEERDEAQRQGDEAARQREELRAKMAAAAAAHAREKAELARKARAGAGDGGAGMEAMQACIDELTGTLETMHGELDAAAKRAAAERERANDLQRQVERLEGVTSDLSATQELLERSRREAAAARRDAEELRGRVRQASQSAADAQAESAATAGELGSARSTLSAIRAQLRQAHATGATAQQAANQIYVALESARARDAAMRAAAEAAAGLRSAAARDAAAGSGPAAHGVPALENGDRAAGHSSSGGAEEGKEGEGGEGGRALVPSRGTPVAAGSVSGSGSEAMDGGFQGSSSSMGGGLPAEGPPADAAALRAAVRAAFAGAAASDVRLYEAEGRCGQLQARVHRLEEELGDSKRQHAQAVAAQRGLQRQVDDMRWKATIDRRFGSVDPDVFRDAAGAGAGASGGSQLVAGGQGQGTPHGMGGAEDSIGGHGKFGGMRRPSEVAAEEPPAMRGPSGGLAADGAGSWGQGGSTTAGGLPGTPSGARFADAALSPSAASFGQASGRGVPAGSGGPPQMLGSLHGVVFRSKVGQRAAALAAASPRTMR